MLIGVVGKANTGKSTFFKAATLAEVLIANYPFATIKPNSGVGYVKVECADKFFNTQCSPKEGWCINHKRFVPIQLIDVAGLVPGAHEGKGMGNQFLDDLRQADALIHIVDIAGSTNDKGEPVNPGEHDPADDIQFLEEELDFWILRLIQKGWEKFSRGVQQTHTEVHIALHTHLSGLGVTEDTVKKVIEDLHLNQKNIVDWTESDLLHIASVVRKRTKPMIIACNKIDMPNAEANFERIKKEFPDYILVRVSSESELALREAAKHGLIDYIPGENNFNLKDPSKLSDKQKAALGFIKTNILDRFGSTGVQEVLDTAVLKILDYIPVFSVPSAHLADQYGRVLPDCFLMPSNITALEFAFKLHTDFGNKFIRAIDVKKKLTVGKDHKLLPGDVIEIVADK
jgi:ribosome-binding ATPase YchF (GTP1/OBG family)